MVITCRICHPSSTRWLPRPDRSLHPGTSPAPWMSLCWCGTTPWPRVSSRPGTSPASPRLVTLAPSWRPVSSPRARSGHHCPSLSSWAPITWASPLWPDPGPVWGQRRWRDIRCGGRVWGPSPAAGAAPSPWTATSSPRGSGGTRRSGARAWPRGRTPTSCPPCPPPWVSWTSGTD